MSFTSSIYLTKHFPSFFTRPVRAFPKRSTPSGSRFANQRSSWILSTSNETVGETASCWSSVSLSFGFWLVHIALSDISWLASEISSSELIKKCKIWVCLKMLFTPPKKVMVKSWRSWDNVPQDPWNWNVHCTSMIIWKYGIHNMYIYIW